MSEDQFVEAVTQGQSIAPLYFAFAADSNRRDRELLDDHRVTPEFDLNLTLRQQAEGAVVIDGRSAELFASGHLRGAINVGLDGRFAEYAGDILRPGQTVIVITDPGRENEARVRLARIGFDHVIGALHNIDQVLVDHPELSEQAPRVTASEVQERRLAEPDLQIIDVRNPGEVEAGAISGALNLPLPQLLDRMGELDPSRPTIVYCAGGYRSATAASLLRAHGFANVADIYGGYGAVCSTS
jgi:hydroxyacylglutathione hydrolase